MGNTTRHSDTFLRSFDPKDFSPFSNYDYDLLYNGVDWSNSQRQWYKSMFRVYREFTQVSKNFILQGLYTS